MEPRLYVIYERLTANKESWRCRLLVIYRLGEKRK